MGHGAALSLSDTFTSAFSRFTLPWSRPSICQLHLDRAVRYFHTLPIFPHSPDVCAPTICSVCAVGISGRVTVATPRLRGRSEQRTDG
ncbi:hypothetical protein AOLI_G00115260 [Acnodon oligacanthus]